MNAMLRPTSQATRLLMRTHVMCPVILGARFESTTTPSKYTKQAIRDHEAKLRDWRQPQIRYQELKQKTKSPAADSYLIDVREPEEVMQGMIPSAVNIPLSVFDKALAMKKEEFKEKFGFDQPPTSCEVIFYCRSGKRSSSASDLAKAAGYDRIYNYKGSWLDWVKQEVKMATRSDEEP